MLCYLFFERPASENIANAMKVLQVCKHKAIFKIIRSHMYFQIIYANAWQLKYFVFKWVNKIEFMILMATGLLKIALYM